MFVILSLIVSRFIHSKYEITYVESIKYNESTK